jgi:hypothetical protein
MLLSRPVLGEDAVERFGAGLGVEFGQLLGG